jgi:L-lactate dehydrogenase complex protein LldE
MIVDIFIPCFIDQIYPQTGMNMVKVLEHLGVTVHYNPEQTCCGQIAFNGGFWDEAKAMGEKMLKDFPNNRPVVCPSASCAGFIKNHYGKLFHNTGLHIEYKQLVKNMVEFSDYIVNHLKKTDIGATFNHTVTYHDSCASLREYGLKNEPRELLSRVNGLQLIEMKHTEDCCGFGGTFAVKFEAISSAMAEQKVQHIVETGAEYVVSTDASCLMQIGGYIKKHNLKVKTAHLADVLASGI